MSSDGKDTKPDSAERAPSSGTSTRLSARAPSVWGAMRDALAALRNLDALLRSSSVLYRTILGLLPELRVQPGGRAVRDDHVVLLAAAERDRRAADREALARQAALQPHDRCLHRAISHPHARITARP